MEALKLFFAAIGIGLIIHLIARLSARMHRGDKGTPPGAASPPPGEKEPPSPSDRISRSFARVEEALSDSLYGADPSACTRRDASACASCTEDCAPQMTKKPAKKIIYYDDEELDVLANRTVESYTDTELAMLREVAETLRREDCTGWLESISKRGILLPASILEIVQKTQYAGD